MKTFTKCKWCDEILRRTPVRARNGLTVVRWSHGKGKRAHCQEIQDHERALAARLGFKRADARQRLLPF